MVGLIKGIFNNDNDIMERLNAMGMGEFFNELNSEVASYYNR